MREGFYFIVSAGLIAVSLWPSAHKPFGEIGVSLARTLGSLFGMAAWWWPLFLVQCAWRCVMPRANVASTTRHNERGLDLRRCLKAAVFLALLCTGLHLFRNAGGRVGASLSSLLLEEIGGLAYAIIALALLGALRLWLGPTRAKVLNNVLTRSCSRFVAAWRAASAQESVEHALASASSVTSTVDAVVIEEHPELPADDAVDLRVSPPPLPSATRSAAAENTPRRPALAAATAQTSAGETVEVLAQPQARLVLPPVALLTRAANSVRQFDELLGAETSFILKQYLQSLGVLADIRVRPGPFVTTYEIVPDASTRISKIRGLDDDDLHMLLKQHVRLVIGAGYVGIEVPHVKENRELVTLRELLEDPACSAFRDAGADLPFVLGKDPRGKPVYADLERVPHLLVGGTTGSGKSVGLNGLITSMIMQCSPSKLRLLLIDRKVVEFAPYSGIPHLIAPVIAESEKALGALQWASDEMERRYRVFKQVKVKKLEQYIALDRAHEMPRIVVVADEIGRLLEESGEQLEALLIDLASRGRAAGIHLVLATQSPRAEIITGNVKSNLSGRIAYHTASRGESSIILDKTGAEYLLGDGDMLCKLPGEAEPLRVHGAFVSDDDVARVCDFLRRQSPPEYDERALSAIAAGAAVSAAAEGGAKWEQVLPLARAFLLARAEALEDDDENAQQNVTCSISELQREFGIGYNGAAKIIGCLEREGLVGPAKTGGQRREVLRPAAS